MKFTPEHKTRPPTYLEQQLATGAVKWAKMPTTPPESPKPGTPLTTAAAMNLARARARLLHQHRHIRLQTRPRAPLKELPHVIEVQKWVPPCREDCWSKKVRENGRYLWYAKVARPVIGESRLGREVKADEL